MTPEGGLFEDWDKKLKHGTTRIPEMEESKTDTGLLVFNSSFENT